MQTSCNNPAIKKAKENKFAKLIADTVGNQKALFDYYSYLHYNDIAKQLNLRNIDNGCDTIELRLWINYGLSPIDELVILKGVDTGWTYSYYQIDINNEHGSYTNSIVDSSSSKSLKLLALYRDQFIDSLKIDSIWPLPSQSQINIPKGLGWTDGTIYCLEIADKTRFKFISYTNPDQYYMHLRDKNHLAFCHLINLLQTPIEKFNMRNYRD